VELTVTLTCVVAMWSRLWHWHVW